MTAGGGEVAARVVAARKVETKGPAARAAISGGCLGPGAAGAAGDVAATSTIRWRRSLRGGIASGEPAPHSVSLSASTTRSDAACTAAAVARASAERSTSSGWRRPR